MAFKDFQNNVQNVPITNVFTDTTLTIVLATGYGALFPATNGRITVELVNSMSKVIKREVIDYATRSWDTLQTLTRSVELCVQDDTASPRTRTQNTLDFTPTSGQVVVVSMRYTEGNDKEIKAQISQKANDTTVVHNTDNESVDGIKTFVKSPIVPTPIANTQVANKVYVDNQITALWGPSAVFMKNEIAWEDLADNDSVFLERCPEYTEAFTAHNIWDVSANKRKAYRQISSWDFSWFSIAIDRFWSPSTNLIVELYVNNLTWSPIWTATVLNTSITTTKQLLWVNRDSSFTMPPKWTTIFYVFKQTGDTVNASNYYRIYWTYRHTTTRYAQSYNTSWWSIDNNFMPFIGIGYWSATITDAHNITFNDTWAWFTATYWCIISSKIQWTITKVTKTSTTTATRVLIVDNTSWTTLWTATFSWNIATFSTPIAINIWEQYRVLVDNNGSSYNIHRYLTATFPVNRTHINYVWGWHNGAWSSSFIWWVVDIETTSSVSPTVPLLSTVVNNLISKTSASYLYKLPIDCIRIVQVPYISWETVSSAILWTVEYTWMSWKNVFFISNTPGLISIVPWTNRYEVWYSSVKWRMTIGTPILANYETYWTTNTVVTSTKTNWFNQANVKLWELSIPKNWLYTFEVNALISWVTLFLYHWESSYTFTSTWSANIFFQWNIPIYIYYNSSWTSWSNTVSIKSWYNALVWSVLF